MTAEALSQMPIPKPFKSQMTKAIPMTILPILMNLSSIGRYLLVIKNKNPATMKVTMSEVGDIEFWDGLVRELRSDVCSGMIELRESIRVTAARKIGLCVIPPLAVRDCQY